MSDFAQKNYQDLMNLVKKDESFFFKDFNLEGNTYRIFNYRLASWTSFMEPSAINCRGIMFDVTNEADVKLVSLPPEKFFNYEEGGVDHSKGRLGDKMVKMDGSLISTYTHNDSVYLKSKGSLFSSQANDAMKLLDSMPEFKQEVSDLVKKGYTMNLEYTSPENRIVIPYQIEDLTVLSVRNHETGENFFATKLKNLLNDKYPEILKHLVNYENLNEQELNQNVFVNAVRDEQEGEGYVVEIVLSESESYLVKIKNLKYVALHQTKDSVNSPKRLFEAIINEASDDLRSMFADDPYILGKIAEMEAHVQPVYNHIIKTVEDFHAENKDLARKDYAIKVQKEQPDYLGLLMNAYLGKANNYKEYAIKHRKEIFGITDEEPELDEDGNIVSRHPAKTMAK
jgi:T4 RnlA family RNA ligase